MKELDQLDFSAIHWYYYKDLVVADYKGIQFAEHYYNHPYLLGLDKAWAKWKIKNALRYLHSNHW